MKKVKVILSNPLNSKDVVDYNIDVADDVMSNNWYGALNGLLINRAYLEKNFCFMGFPNTARNLEFLCRELNWAKDKINNFFNDYKIEEDYRPNTLRNGLEPDQEIMNKLHNHFEVLQGTVWGLSEYYKRADYETKFAIRQLNNICHEAESLMLSQKKQVEAPQWMRPSQITTFLNAPRFDYPEVHKKTFDKSRYDRTFGTVYQHWTQIGKTLYEVYVDEDGKDIDQAECEAITHLRYYSGEFDIEWSRDVTYSGDYPWHKQRMDGFAEWLERNGFRHDDPQYNFGYHQVGQVDIKGSFGTDVPEEVWEILGNHLNIVQIETNQVIADYRYSWADADYKQQQIDMLKPGYDYSSRR
jgi:hypothetical protein